MDIVDQATRVQADQLLAGIAGPGASLRDDQWTAIDALVNQRRRMLVVQRTGWGKSAVYFIAAKLLRERGAGASLIISPLLALMRNQVAAAERAGIKAATLNSANMTQWQQIQQQVAAGEIDVLLISPERLNNPGFRDEVLPRLAESVGMIVVDEAHCISDWGHDFRPDYRRIRDLLAGLREGVPVLATTATANDRVVADVQSQLGAHTGLLRGGLDRESLHLSVVSLPDTTARPAWLATQLAQLSGSGIIYCLTVAAAEDLAQALESAGWNVAAYTGRTEAEERARLEQALLGNELKALVATSALGMGFDKPDLGFVVHLGAPGSPVSYYQQIGRAGRGTDRAEVILLPGAEDREIWEYFASISFPGEAVVRQLLGVLNDQAQSTVRLEAQVDLSRSRLEQVLKVLDVDGVVRRVQGGWISTGSEWHYDAQRYLGLRQARQQEQQAMLDYQSTTGCRMLFLRRQLDDNEAMVDCGRCDNCTGNRPTELVDEQMANTISGSLNAPGVQLAARKQWPTGISVRGKIKGLEPGRALGRLNDIARGPALRELLAEKTWRPVHNWRQDTWLPSIVEVLATWEWTQRPGTVIALGSTEPATTELVAATAEAIAGVGQMNFGGLLPVRAGAQEVAAQNSAYRVAGLLGQWDLSVFTGAEFSDGPILLVTDLVDTGWSVTVAGVALAEVTGRQVLPFALASRG
ncbi:RecQ family ATP-dependent DNA helicase [Corynebacterium alimapuense]|uniref:DNA 3'-5' helicase n=1 Tax=Corynebacterium alimapuense TaxID=1576874 RepID=A0A3M8K747_9CORY|nr:ATP-dependent DNA helicase RecQ [Corynebacterium alimapuense]RNE48585.1 recombinase RecQ [Corynebacterium alimapuense]